MAFLDVDRRRKTITSNSTQNKNLCKNLTGKRLCKWELIHRQGMQWEHYPKRHHDSLKNTCQSIGPLQTATKYETLESTKHQQCLSLKVYYRESPALFKIPSNEKNSTLILNIHTFQVLNTWVLHSSC